MQTDKMITLAATIFNCAYFIFFTIAAFKNKIKCSYKKALLIGVILTITSSVITMFFITPDAKFRSFTIVGIIIWAILNLFMLFISIEAEWGKILFLLLILMNFYNDLVMLSMSISDIIYSRFSLLIHHGVINIFVLICFLPAMYYLMIKLFRKVAEINGLFSFWKYMWLIPLLTYLYIIIGLINNNWVIPVYKIGDFIRLIIWTAYGYISFALVLSIQIQMYKVYKTKKDILIKETEIGNIKENLKRSKISLMLSQIKPHFIYNTLSAIQAMIKVDPDKAFETISYFATFLRANINSIESEELIPIEKEIEHIKAYTEIEKIRFGDKLKIVYDIKAADFYVPPLTVQPLVENAVKHGVCKRVDGGTVTIKTYNTEEYNYIEIIDDGVGFDISSLDYQKNSIGICNIKYRLKQDLNAVINIQSNIGEGTNVLIRILREGDNNENGFS